MCLFMGVSVLFSGCSENNAQVPDLNQNDAIANSLKSKKIPTQFTGTCKSLDYEWTDGAVAFIDDASDARVSGVSKWYTTKFEPIDDITNELAGTAEIFVGTTTVDQVLNGNYDGKWEMTWKGTQTLTSQEGSTFKIVAHGVGTGTEGEVFGLTARWKYTTDESLIYVSKGKITETE